MVQLLHWFPNIFGIYKWHPTSGILNAVFVWVPLPFLFFYIVSCFFGSTPASLVCSSSCAMALLESWRLLEKAILLQQATGAAKDVLNKGGDLRLKQRQVQYLLTDVDINSELFECIFSELEEQMDDLELESYHEVWRVEVTMAGQTAQKEIARICEGNGFHTSDIEVIAEYVMSSFAVTKHKRKIREASSYIEEAIDIAYTDELSSLENAMKVNLQKVVKAQRLRHCEEHSILLASPQKVPAKLNAKLAEVEVDKDTHVLTLAAESNQQDRTVDGDKFEKCLQSTGQALQYAHSDISALTLMLPCPQSVLTVAPLTPRPYCDFPYKVFSDDDASLPVEIPAGLRCGCSLGCIKLMQYCASGEKSMGKCYGCQQCTEAASANECFCECLGCEQGYRAHFA